ncbi:30S ribosomal protein S15 [Candidatus Woesearchaeota archaeon]|jgi:small subunit ribosomal protein S15|nr:30S ribosomal protein S15 [Candidatus Woesearchaeota archaeon]MBT6519531.1 30S ribosomal protein S15 [Candidatus Woesearchaeota archaeon]MBT7367724.1 30S ribosomal protein S15 [Candidatus Woesearchaeota archaeon]
MARMYSRKKGNSSSKRPIKKTVPSWMGYKPKEVELLIAKLAKEGKTVAQIGLHLRDNYGIPDVKAVTKKKISKILGEKKLLHPIPEDLRDLIKRSLAIRRHLEENHKDQPAKRGLTLTESKVRRLVKYYKQVGKLSVDWKYDFRKAITYLE